MFNLFEIPEKVLKKAEKEIDKFYGISDFTKEEIVISATDESNTPADFSSGNLFHILSKDGELGYGYIGNAPSKTATFDYLVLFDKNWIITKTIVLIYREEYGGEIGSKRWLEQFTGGSSEIIPIKYVEDIIPISGATISAQSMTRAVNELLQSIKYLKSKDRI
jgi:hypothetical protein